MKLINGKDYKIVTQDYTNIMTYDGKWEHEHCDICNRHTNKPHVFVKYIEGVERTPNNISNNLFIGSECIKKLIIEEV